MSQLKTTAPVAWCPGCGNFEIMNSFIAVLEDMRNEGFPLENIIMVSGIGNHGKIVDYVQINSFNSIHGRAIPTAEAIKLANPDTKVVCFVGDGDTYAEGLEHLLFAAKRNIDITVVVHNNRTYALATAQFTPTTQQAYKASTMPYGAKESPFNPLELLLVSGATFIARGYPVKKEHFRKLLKDAIAHRGFSCIDTLQVCVTFNNLYETYNKHVVEVEIDDLTNFEEALRVISSWDYRTSEVPIPIGKFFEVNRPGYEDKFTRFPPVPEDRTVELLQLLDRFI
ncbi:2-oxoglutarate oxidoreductase subunit KorB [Sporotomaculum syntrophicum]|uniref:2-oxoglutarate oxidoreductase subunit KorB n=1 Tax=Sporotomaculum syntrophicum TaxID=182264 RepID=A0A9D2WMK1_9FIRM|nr:thiamine pyrophosphate-dependent enzyme [Sporotomaculum syntrophicum]KAF1083750.1 2-oxoglutarate oxidoreductase subunit KorB [Sporotomaculum syntrophicum]